MERNRNSGRKARGAFSKRRCFPRFAPMADVVPLISRDSRFLLSFYTCTITGMRAERPTIKHQFVLCNEIYLFISRKAPRTRLHIFNVVRKFPYKTGQFTHILKSIFHPTRKVYRYECGGCKIGEVKTQFLLVVFIQP